MPFNPVVTLVDNNGTVIGSASGWPVTDGGTTTVAIANANAANTVVKASAGRLCRVLITTTNTAAVSIYDNATTNTGTIIGAVPASAAVGTSFTFQTPAANGITVGGAATNPAMTVSFT